MKKVIVLLILMVGMTAMAQKGERGNHGEMKDLSAEQIATLQTKKMTLTLDLTQDQQTRIKAMNIEKAKMHKAKIEERKAQREDGESKRPTVEERYAMQNERLDQMIAQKAELKKVLSPEQYEKLEKMQMQKVKKRTNKRGKGRRSK